MPRPATFAPVSIATDPRTGEEYLNAYGTLGHPDAHAALMDWCARVGINPDEVPASEPVIVSADRRRITYTEIPQDAEGRYLVDHAGQRVLELDEPAPPWPDAVLELAALTSSTCPMCGHHWPIPDAPVKAMQR